MANALVTGSSGAVSARNAGSNASHGEYGMTAAPFASSQLLVLVGSEQPHLLAVELAQAADDDTARRHIDAQRQRVRREDRLEVAAREERLHPQLQRGEQPGVVEPQPARQQVGQASHLFQPLVVGGQRLHPLLHLDMQPRALLRRDQQMPRRADGRRLDRLASGQKVQAR
jgi:hypothetical protein